MTNPDTPRYRCKNCGDTPEPETHHKMKSCKCGMISVDRGWYGGRVVSKGPIKETVEDCIEIVELEPVSD